MVTRQFLKTSFRSLRYSVLVAAAIALTLPPAMAQAPQVRTSAPKSKTAIPIGTADKKTPPAPQPKDKKAKAVAKAKLATVTTGDKVFWALKSNLAYDIFAVINIAAEVQVARHFSVELPVNWSLWDWRSSFGLRTVALQPRANYYFANVGTEHSIGLEFDMAWFNFRDHDYRYQGNGRPMLGASIRYAYNLPLAEHWNMEFGLGVGYVNIPYNKYYNIENGAKICSKERNYFGPTSLGISLSYKF